MNMALIVDTLLHLLNKLTNIVFLYVIPDTHIYFNSGAGRVVDNVLVRGSGRR